MWEHLSVVNVLPWILSGVTLLCMWLVGEKNPKGWLLGIFNQGLWLWWITASHSWGLLPLCFALLIIYFRNWIKWT